MIDDRDAQTYTTVEIGTQCWMAENMNIGTMINGSSPQTNNSTIEKYCYDDNTNNCETYGGLYQWDETMQYTTTPGVQGICPTGWHIPTDAEWCTLENYVDAGIVSCPSTGWRCTDAGANLKSVSGWYSGGNGIDLYGFNSLTFYSYFWSSDETGSYAWLLYMSYSFAVVNRDNYYKTYGIPARCLKD